MNFTSAENAFEYLGSFMNFERSRKQTIRDYRLDRMKKLLKHFGNPEKSFKIIHIAGSKGKGSTGILTASALSAAGFKTGLYTSPHISTYKERITLAGSFFNENEYINTVEEIAQRLQSFTIDNETGSSEATTFELLTLMAFLMFKKSGCSWAVIETGIGGRLDATNVVSPEMVVITPIEKEHTDILGNTLEQIAFEKAGIIKKGVPVFTSYQEKPVLSLLREKAKNLSAPFYTLKDYYSSINSVQSTSGNSVTCIKKDGKKIILNLRMTGLVQAENAALALMCLSSINIPFDALSKGFARAVLPGRFEITGTNPVFIFDGAHTPESIKWVIESYKTLFGKKGILVFGAVEGKNIEGMAALLVPLFDHIIISTPGTFKENSPRNVYAVFKDLRNDILLKEKPEEALRTALKLSRSKLPILTTGSFYMVGEIRKLVVQER